MIRRLALFRITPLTAVLSAVMATWSPAFGQSSSGRLPTDRVFQGQVRLPDFAGRDRKYASFRTRIREGMSTGPDFAGHYAIIQIGCGTGYSLALVGDVATGQIYDFLTVKKSINKCELSVP